MRWTRLHAPTLREDPADADAASHRLLLRAGFARQLMAGHYSLLPLGVRVRTRIMDIVRSEMEKIGAQEFLLPALHPAEIWRKTGRWDVMGEEMFRLLDRKGAELGLGMTHEEIFTTVSQELRSFRQLPQIWYQFQTKFRDEARPKGGLLRTREFTMKDSYSFDMDAEGLDRSFALHRAAYERIFARIGLQAIPVQASSGSMGGNTSVEFMSPSEAGEDLIVRCPNCDYAANTEKATSRLPGTDDTPGPSEPERFATPGARTGEELADVHGVPTHRQIRTTAYLVDDQFTLLLLRGDHALVEQKLIDTLNAVVVRPAGADEISTALGASPGHLGPVGVSGIQMLADEALRGRTDLVSGAGEDGVHLRGVSVERDCPGVRWADLREVSAGESCVGCGAPLELVRTVEIGHIFKLGRKYTELLDVSMQGPGNERVVPIMGSYGMGIERAIAAVVETCHDEKGIVWPAAIAPFQVTVVGLGTQPEVVEAAETTYRELVAAGVDTLIDDRDERPGVKLRDAELIGIPFRVTIGTRGLAAGTAEVVTRATGESVPVPLGDLVVHLQGLSASASA
ncbi:proline--tRNA ligase [[Kitasatospora] papulosa]|uniref:proline--tRNA ligase n=1 Tax=[Kitasatospora] papulosa TaxID=1464011 RepID=UPI00368CFA78